MMKLILIFTFIPFLFAQCTSYKSEAYETIEKSGTNGTELLKVIDHYKKEGSKEKLISAYFLIGNLEGKKSKHYPTLIHIYKAIADSIRADKYKNTPYKILNKKISVWKDTLESTLGKFDIGSFETKDIETIKADYLIENIDLAYSAWKTYPWCKSLTFDEYLEYILPYRILDEPLQNWRKNYQQLYKNLVDSMVDPSDPLELCKLVNNCVARNFKFFSSLNYPDIGANDMLEFQIGLCEQRYLMVISALRSLGVPARLDFSPQWSRWPGEHYWIVTLNKKKNIIAFNGGELFFYKNKGNEHPLGGGMCTKVYHVTFKNFRNDRPTIHYPFFNRSNFVDVITQYNNPTRNIEIKVNKPSDELRDEYVYLYAFAKGLDAVPVAFTKAKGNTIKFNHIGRNGIYFLALANIDGFTVLTQPFEVQDFAYPHTSVDTLIFYNPGKKMIDAKLYSKYPVADSMVQFAQAMVEAKFQVSNTSDFEQVTDLFVIRESPWAYLEEKIQNTGKYRYIRYLPFDPNILNIAELSFYEINAKDSTPLRLDGKAFGFVHGKNNTYNFRNAFDNDISSYITCPAKSWIAYDFGEPKHVSVIKYLPRNTLNVIEPGNNYELFYFNYGWQSLGVKKATDFFLNYKVPDKFTLLLLKNHTQGSEERIFILDHWANYRQVFY